MAGLVAKAILLTDLMLYWLTSGIIQWLVDLLAECLDFLLT